MKAGRKPKLQPRDIAWAAAILSRANVSANRRGPRTLTLDDCARALGVCRATLCRHLAMEPMTHIRDLSLRSVRPPIDWAKIHADNRHRYTAAAQRQLDRCEKVLAAESRVLARYRRCPICSGMEDTTDPHHHGAAA